MSARTNWLRHMNFIKNVYINFYLCVRLFDAIVSSRIPHFNRKNLAVSRRNHTPSSPVLIFLLRSLLSLPVSPLYPSLVPRLTHNAIPQTSHKILNPLIKNNRAKNKNNKNRNCLSFCGTVFGFGFFSNSGLFDWISRF